MSDTLLPDPRRGFEGKVALIVVGVRVHRPPDAVRDVDDHAQRRVRHREQLEQLQVARELDAGAPVLDRRRQPKVAPIAQLVPKRQGDLVLALDQLGPALAVVVDVRPDLRAEGLESRFGRGRCHVVTRWRACARSMYF